MIKEFLEKNKGWQLGDAVRCPFAFRTYMLVMVFIFPFFLFNSSPLTSTRHFGDYFCDWLWVSHTFALIFLVGASPDSSAL